ncbi:hypothetical protein EM595_2314 [Duffyella gerundensis]|uniref:Uncharacterized protein n=1 Tax=Duffyella gerundensis TaxID=1619313 RepID=A0A0U5L781_9GAMM|nr:hypothetical protein EM595_2314 [Duffyella gerundensis]
MAVRGDIKKQATHTVQWPQSTTCLTASLFNASASETRGDSLYCIH